MNKTSTAASLAESSGAGGGERYMDPFAGLFTAASTIPLQPLIDRPHVHRLFESISWGQAENLYGYQQPLTGMSGPWVERGGRRFLMLSAYDYLGLIGHPAISAGAVAAIGQHGTGTGGVRLLSGTAAIHLELERALAEHLGTESALTFNSGYAANLAALGTLLEPGDVALLDAYAHRSLYDGCRLAGAKIQPFAHNDIVDLERHLASFSPAHRCLVAVDGVYSMDGDVCPLPALIEITRRYKAFLLVDEAHALGTAGARGGGTADHYGIDAGEIDLITGSLSKAIPAGGGFVAGRRATLAYLQHVSGAYVYSAGLPPPCAGAALAAIRVMKQEPERLVRLKYNADRLKNGLLSLGFDIGQTSTPILPVITGSNESAYRLARHLFDAGVIALPVIPPAVPRGTARLRLCVTAAHADDDLDMALSAFASLAPSGRC
jgi:glycine C-acetyltransferase